MVLRLWSGSTFLRVRTRGSARFEVETPAGTVRALDRGMLRVDVDAGETRVSVYAGEAVLDDGRRQVRLAAGERTFARWGAEAEEPRRFEPGGENDDFSRWDGMRESEDRWAARSSEYLPDELDAYAGEFERNGQWQYESTVGYVWVPARRVRLAALLERPLGVDALRLHLGPLRALGLGPLPLRALGPVGVLRLVLGARPHLGPGLGELGGGRRLRGLVPPRLARPAGPALGLGLPRRPRGAARPLRAGPLERRASRRPRGPRRGAATRGLRPDRAGRPPRGGLGRPSAHSRRAQPARRRRRPARHQPEADARRFRARAGRRQQDDDPGAVDARLRAAARGSRRGALRRAAPIGRRGEQELPDRTHPPPGRPAGRKGARRGRASARRRGTRRARRRAPRASAGRRHGRPPRPEPRAAGRVPSGARCAARNRAAASSLPSAPRGASPPPVALAGGAGARAPAVISRAARPRAPGVPAAQRGRRLQRVSAARAGARAPAAIVVAAVATTPEAPSRAPNAARRVPPGTKAAARRPVRRAAARAGRAPVATRAHAPAATGSSPAPRVGGPAGGRS